MANGSNKMDTGTKSDYCVFDGICQKQTQKGTCPEICLKFYDFRQTGPKFREKFKRIPKQIEMEL